MKWPGLAVVTLSIATSSFARAPRVTEEFAVMCVASQEVTAVNVVPYYGGAIPQIFVPVPGIQCQRTRTRCTFRICAGALTAGYPGFVPCLVGGSVEYVRATKYRRRSIRSDDRRFHVSCGVDTEIPRGARWGEWVDLTKPSSTLP